MIRLHHVPQARSFRTLWLLEEMGLEFEVVEHAIFGRALREPEYLALSPAGRVPALEIDGGVLFESGAITEYLCETRPGFAPPPGAPERANWLEWLHFAETIGQHCANLTQNHIILREDWMRSPTLMKLEARRLAACLAVVDRVVTGQDWLLASGFSAVDTNIGYGIDIARRFVDLPPGIAAYRSRYQARPGYLRAAARDGVPQLYTRAFYPLPDA